MKQLLLATALFLAACETLPVVTPPTEVKPIPLAWDGKHSQAKAWTETLLAELDKTKLMSNMPTDILDYCPNYSRASASERRVFWANLFAIIVKYECSFNPLSSSVDVGVAGNKDTYSVGLFQMSVVDQKNYRLSLGFTYDDLLDGSKNIQLAIPIASHLITQDNRIGGKVAGNWKGMARYWAVMRLSSTSAYADKSAKAIRDYTRMLEVCR
jgi:hypothetical protein